MLLCFSLAAALVIVLIALPLYYRSKFTSRLNKVQEEKTRLIQLEKMASLGTLAAGIAHEINNPLTFVITDLNILTKHLENIETGKKEEIKTILEECLEGSDRIKRIVQDLLSFSHPSQGKALLSDINRLLDATTRVLWNEIKYKADIVKDYKITTQLWIDPSQISQVFLNIVINAVQAIKTKGTVYIATYEDADSVFIKITDTGVGIEKDSLSKIFEPFYTTKGGTGLGLSVSKDIVERYHGKIQVDSTVGKGSSFTIAIPKDKNTYH